MTVDFAAVAIGDVLLEAIIVIGPENDKLDGRKKKKKSLLLSIERRLSSALLVLVRVLIDEKVLPSSLALFLPLSII